MIQVTAAIFRDQGRVLICRRKPGIRHAGKWEFPGGKIEEGESPEFCLVREMKEEFNISVSVGSFFAENIFQYGRGPVHLLAFHVKWLSGDMQPRDHDQLKWVNPLVLGEYDLLPADIPFADKLRIQLEPQSA